ncbi:MAG: DciA family protein [Acidimicrobiales bacterium]
MTWRPAKGEPPPRRVGESIEGVLAACGVGAPTMVAVAACWDDLVGPSLASHLRPVRMEGTRLVVAADHPSWATQVRVLEVALVARLGEAVGPGRVQSLRPVVAPV